MHEHGIARDMFAVITKAAADNGLKKITRIRIKIGAGSGVAEDFLRHSFVDHIFAGTIAEGTKLELVMEPVKVSCRVCKNDAPESEKPSLICPACGGKDWDIVSGQDVYVDDIEGDK